MVYKEGFGGTYEKNNSYLNNNYVNNLAQNLSNLITIARVTDILLSENDSFLFNNFGEWNGLGLVKYETLDIRTQTITGYAKPIDSNLKKLPLINELIYIILGPNTNIGENPNSINAYYINTISLWNHPHHNGYPSNNIDPTIERDYDQTQAGSVRRVEDNSTGIYLGKTFLERSNIHPLLPFEGDTILEGRWGNSIRFGSTVKSTQNNWSNFGQNGDPITIIRNGQGQQTDQGWIPVLENINIDNSSIYLTSTQQVPIDVSSKSYNSYPNLETPIKPDKYTENQIIISSGRLVFNSSNDHLLLTSAKSINLNSQTSVNIDTPKFIIQSNKIYLGQNEAYEPLMLGTQTNNLLTDLVEALISFMTIAEAATTNLIPFPDGSSKNVTLPTINSSATDVLFTLKDLNDKLKKNNLISKRNFTV